MKLVREHINFQRGLDPKDAMGIGDSIARIINQHVGPNFFSQKKKDLEKSIRTLMNEIVKDPSWDGELNYISDVVIDTYWTGNYDDPKEPYIEIGHPWHTGSRGKEVKRILKLIGIKPTDSVFHGFIRGDYRYYQIPIKPLPIKESHSFQRGLDPKAAMGTGVFANIPETILNAGKAHIEKVHITPTRMIIHFYGGMIYKDGKKIAKSRYITNLMQKLELQDFFVEDGYFNYSSDCMEYKIKPENYKKFIRGSYYP